MRAERSLPESKEEYVYKVMQWKWAPAKTAPWWQRAFFYCIFLPFQNLSLSVFKIPPMKEVVIESDERGRVRKTYRWFEDEAIFDHEDQADRACLDEHWGYRKTIKNRLHPSESTQTFGTIFPRKKNPRKWIKPTFSLMAKNRKQEEKDQETLTKYITRLHQALDR